MKNKGPKNGEVLQTVALLEKTGRKEKKAFWKDIAKRIVKPRRQRVSVNVWKLNKVNQKLGKKFLLVPGKVLSFGTLEKPINVIALEYSKAAKKKISEKGKALSIRDAINEKIKTNDIAIIG
ncbi:MAG: 50S ribosomal protein L18e [Candidatus Diapherotrites archaeon]|uniref:50S ribosomal protein L18e n=1 Tax=Candidatus Iainarchaeum sp. TaxID=3101447 RepID=A0A2D6M0L6_9ARCH|nr:50S ribosomal protein L18e [Candidatus Diapherotrites archaeon]